MTSDTIRKRAERLRRKEAGEVRVEVWFAADEAEWIKRMTPESVSGTSQEVIRWCVCQVMESRK